MTLHKDYVTLSFRLGVFTLVLARPHSLPLFSVSVKWHLRTRSVKFPCTLAEQSQDSCYLPVFCSHSKQRAKALDTVGLDSGFAGPVSELKPASKPVLTKPTFSITRHPDKLKRNKKQLSAMLTL